MTPSTRIPATVITGFLGAGKSTLIRNLIRQADGRRIALIINEFGDMGFDGELLSDCGDPACKADEIVELTNGCICCTVADDFLPTIEELLARDPAPDHIVIETSGLALPQPLVRAFNWPTVRNRVTVDGVVTVVDGSAVADGRVAADEEAVARQRLADEALDHESPIDELFEDQLRCADLVVINKADLIGDAGVEDVVARIGRQLRPSVHHVAASHGVVPIDVLLGLDSAAEDDMGGRAAHHEHHHEGEDEPHAHDHDDFDSFVITPRVFNSIDELRDAVILAMNAKGVLRIKGRARVAGKEAMAHVQAVGARVETWFAPAGSSTSNNSGLVVIGLHDDLDRALLERLIVGASVAAAE